MKYKLVVFRNVGGTSDDAPNAGSFTFFTFNEAHSCANAWVNQAGDQWQARLWDGSIWRTYS
tara:strand:+ start:458 stop:643 length:186 start_codon:yes stop_codon:yes gene_type:complete